MAAAGVGGPAMAIHQASSCAGAVQQPWPWLSQLPNRALMQPSLSKRRLGSHVRCVEEHQPFSGRRRSYCPPGSAAAALVVPLAVRAALRWESGSKAVPRGSFFAPLRRFGATVAKLLPLMMRWVFMAELWLLRLLLGARAMNLNLLTLSATDVVRGRFDTLRLELLQSKRGFRFQLLSIEYNDAILGIKPFLLALAPVVAIFWGYLLLPLVLLVLFLPSRDEVPEAMPAPGKFTACLSVDDLRSCGIWRRVLEGILRHIMENSVAGVLALPREVGGQLSDATSFELQSVDITDGLLVFGAAAKLPDATTLNYTLRFSADVGRDVVGRSCVVWQDPEVKVTPGWGLPVFWAPIGGFAGSRPPRPLRITSIQILPGEQLELQGELGGPEEDNPIAGLWLNPPLPRD